MLDESACAARRGAATALLYPFCRLESSSQPFSSGNARTRRGVTWMDARPHTSHLLCPASIVAANQVGRGRLPLVVLPLLLGMLSGCSRNGALLPDLTESAVLARIAVPPEA